MYSGPIPARSFCADKSASCEVNPEQQDGVSTQESQAISTQVLHERDLLDYNRFRLLHASIAMSEPNRKEEHKPAAGRKKRPCHWERYLEDGLSTVQINAAKHTLGIPPAQINAAK